MVASELVKVSEYARRCGVTRGTVLRWANSGLLDIERTPGLILIRTPKQEKVTEPEKLLIGYARVSSHSQKESLTNQEQAIYKYCAQNGLKLDKVITEIGSGFNEKRKQINKLLADPNVNLIVEHRDRLSRSNYQLISAALKAQERTITIINQTNQEQDLLQELSEFLVSKCASIYGKRGAKRKAEQLVQEAKTP